MAAAEPEVPHNYIRLKLRLNRNLNCFSRLGNTTGQMQMPFDVRVSGKSEMTVNLRN